MHKIAWINFVRSLLFSSSPKQLYLYTPLQSAWSCQEEFRHWLHRPSLSAFSQISCLCLPPPPHVYDITRPTSMRDPCSLSLSSSLMLLSSVNTNIRWFGDTLIHLQIYMCNPDRVTHDIDLCSLRRHLRSAEFCRHRSYSDVQYMVR